MCILQTATPRKREWKFGHRQKINMEKLDNTVILTTEVTKPNNHSTKRKLLHLPLLPVTISYVHAAKAQHWLKNYPADHYLLLQFPCGLAKFLPVLLNHWQAMIEPDTVPGMFYDSATQSQIAFDDHEDFLASVQPEKQLKKGSGG